MVEKFGVSLDEELAEWIESDLEYGEKRSARIEDLCRQGRALETVFDQYDLDVPERDIEMRTLLREIMAAATDPEDAIDLAPEE